MSSLLTDEHIESCFLLVRGHLVLLQSDLARFLKVPAARLLAHAQLFPGEFCFPLEPAENIELGGDGSDGRPRPHVFSEHGALLVACMINTPESMAVGIQVTRAFIRFRQKAMHPHALAFAG